jgi:hypothetical protein
MLCAGCTEIVAVSTGFGRIFLWAEELAVITGCAITWIRFCAVSAWGIAANHAFFQPRLYVVRLDIVFDTVELGCHIIIPHFERWVTDSFDKICAVGPARVKIFVSLL